MSESIKDGKDKPLEVVGGGLVSNEMLERWRRKPYPCLWAKFIREEIEKNRIKERS